MIRKIMLVCLLTLTVAVFTGCQTVQGLGNDVQWMGKQTSSLAANAEDALNGEQ